MRYFNPSAPQALASSELLKIDIVDSWSTWLQTGAAVFTALALVVGGIWAYFRFRRGRTFMPRCSINLSCSMAVVDSREVLIVNIGITNCGDTNVIFKIADKGRVEVSPVNTNEWSRLPAGKFILWREADPKMRQDFFAHAQQKRKETGLEPGQDLHRSCLFVMPIDWAAAQVRCLLRLGTDDEAPEWVATRVVIRPTSDETLPPVRRTMHLREGG